MNLAQYKTRVEGGLIRLFDNQARLSPSDETRLLIHRLKKVTTQGGKRFRPTLFYLTFKAYGGHHCSINVGVAIELLHQALLIHDDLIDEDIYRHGKLNIVGLYKKEEGSRFSNLPYSMGLIAGDLCFSLITKLIIEDKSLSLEAKLSILSLFSQTIADTIYGEQLDSLNSNSATKIFDEKEQTKIHKLKTASYSTLLPMKLAAIILDLPKSETQLINIFANSLGIYYQLVNDYEDYFKKSNGEYLLKDFSVGKLTYPKYIAQDLMTAKQTRKVDHFYSKSNLNNNQKSLVVEILTNSGAKKAAQDYVKLSKNRSVAMLDKLRVSTKGKTELLALIDSLKV